MKRLVYFLTFLFFLSGCKSDVIDQEEIMKPVVGKWLLKEIETTVSGEKIWIPVSNQNPVILNFRPDGLPVDENGEVGCCPPSTLRINGKLVAIKPKQPLINNHPCLTVLCPECDLLIIETLNEEIMISTCQGNKTKYARF